MYTHENATRTHSDREDRTLLCEIAPSITINPIRPGLRASHAAQYLARISHASRTHASRTHATRPNIAACHLISSRSHRAAGPLGPPSQRITPCRYPLFLKRPTHGRRSCAPARPPRARPRAKGLYKDPPSHLWANRPRCAIALRRNPIPIPTPTPDQANPALRPCSQACPACAGGACSGRRACSLGGSERLRWSSAAWVRVRVRVECRRIP